jgi:precorrin-6A/cobalt-precorrin-6A reductase
MTGKGSWPDNVMAKTKVLILGGTGKARELAQRVVPMFSDVAEIISSQAGVTFNPKTIPGRLVTGGFGGISGLVEFMEREQVQIIIDATHPFAETISDSAYVACTMNGAKRLTLGREMWNLPPGARWVEVETMKAAADEISNSVKRVFITTGRRGLEAFSKLDDIWFLVRMIDKPTAPINLAKHQIITGHPPFEIASERELLLSNSIDTLVSKNSGGSETMGKITAALEIETPIILLRQPEKLPGLWTSSVDDCLQWLAEQI